MADRSPVVDGADVMAIADAAAQLVVSHLPTPELAEIVIKATEPASTTLEEVTVVNEVVISSVEVWQPVAAASSAEEEQTSQTPAPQQDDTVSTGLADSPEKVTEADATTKPTKRKYVKSAVSKKQLLNADKSLKSSVPAETQNARKSSRERKASLAMDGTVLEGFRSPAAKKIKLAAEGSAVKSTRKKKDGVSSPVSGSG